MVPCGSLWFLMVPYGFLWFLMVPFGSLWFLIGPYGPFLRVPFWFLMAPYSFYGPLGSFIFIRVPIGSLGFNPFCSLALPGIVD